VLTPLDVVLHVAVTLVAPPLLLGVINKTKAAFAGRVGPPLLQPYFDLARLFRKGSVFSTTTTWVFRAGPVVALVAALFAAQLVPYGARGAALSFAGDMILFAYLFALGRFFTVAAALDTGSAFEGMGGAREATFSCFAEPALFLGLMVLVRLTGSSSLATMFGAGLGAHWATTGASLVMVLASLLVVLLVENSRIPFDDPNTHLELTMIHEVMVLDHSGPLFGAVLYGAAIKLFVLGAVVVRLALPMETGVALYDWGIFAAGMLGLAVAIGVVESVMARLRMRQVPSLLVGACLLSAFGIVLLAR
jgi:formate hydrogenlyase subunit 4